MKKHLNDQAIRSLKTTGKQYAVFDEHLNNFGVRVGVAGTKSFFVLKGDARQRVHLGKYPAVPVQDARRAAQELLLDRSPVSAKETLLEAYSAFLSAHVEPNYSKTSASEAHRLFHKHCKHLHSTSVADISPRSIMGITDALQSTPSEANHLFSILRTAFAWFVQRQYIETSPLGHMKKPYRERARERVLTDAELGKLWRALSLTHGHYATILQLLILTGQRRGEIASLRWEYIQDGAVLFPKTKNGTPHLLPTTPQIREQLGYGDKKSEWLFPNRHGTDYFNGWCLKRGLDEHLKFETPFCLHDLRRSLASGLARVGSLSTSPVSPHIIERILNHATPTTPIAAVYNRFNYLEEMRAALTLWSNHVTSLPA